jgi:lipoate-protein ligase A
VINLAEVSKGLSVFDVIRSLKESFVKNFHGTIREIDMEPKYFDIEALERKYSSWEWRFGKTPMFNVSIMRRFSWGEVTLNFCLKNGCIDSVQVFPGALEDCFKRDIRKLLTGCPFRSERMIERLITNDRNLNQQADVLFKDIVLWLSETKF